MRDARYNHRPTVPVYDFANMPQDAIEGQHALTTGGCYAWYQGGRWHEICPLDGDPLVSVPAYTIVMQDAKATSLTVGRNTSLGLPVETHETYTTSAAIPTGAYVFGIVSCSYTFFDDGAGTRYWFNVFPGVEILSGNLQEYSSVNTNLRVDNAQVIDIANLGNNSSPFTPLPIQSTALGTSGDISGAMIQNFVQMKNMSGAPIASGTVFTTNWIPGRYDGGVALSTGPRGMMMVAFDPSVITPFGDEGTGTPNNGLIQYPHVAASYNTKNSTGVGDVLVRTRLKLRANEKDWLFLFGVIIDSTSDLLDFTNSRVTKLGSMVVGSTFHNQHRMYLCARPISAKFFDTQANYIDLRIPFNTSIGTPVQWALSGTGLRLTTTTRP